LAVRGLGLHQIKLLRCPRLANVCILYRSNSKENLCVVNTLSCWQPTTYWLHGLQWVWSRHEWLCSVYAWDFMAIDAADAQYLFSPVFRDHSSNFSPFW